MSVVVSFVAGGRLPALTLHQLVVRRAASARLRPSDVLLDASELRPLDGAVGGAAHVGGPSARPGAEVPDSCRRSIAVRGAYRRRRESRAGEREQLDLQRGRSGAGESREPAPIASGARRGPVCSTRSMRTVAAGRRAAADVASGALLRACVGGEADEFAGVESAAAAADIANV